MDSKAYFEKVMQDFNQFRNGRSLRKYCTDEGIDYNWLIKYKKDYPGKRTEEQPSSPLEFVPISVKDEPQKKDWQVHHLILQSPSGDVLEIKSSSLSVVAMLLEKMSTAMSSMRSGSMTASSSSLNLRSVRRAMR